MCARVHARVGKVGGDAHIHGMLDEKLLEFVERLVDDRADGRGFETELDFVGVELRHLGSFADQAVQAVALLVDDGQQFVFSSGGMRFDAAEQRSHRCFDGGERRAKFVGDGIEQHRAQLFAFARGFGAAQFFDRAGALDGDRDQAADRLQVCRERTEPETPMLPTTRMPMRSGMKASCWRGVEARLAAQATSCRSCASRPSIAGPERYTSPRLAERNGRGADAE